jgi:hypothetical protein
MKFETRHCSPEELPTIEAKLQAKGFRLTQKTRQEDLNPMEYMKRSYRGTPDSFEGPLHWEVTQRHKD